MDTSEYNSSTIFSDSLDASLSADVDQTEDYSLRQSRKTFSETDITGKSFSDGNRTTYDGDYTTGYDSGIFLSRSFNTRTFDDESFPRSPLSDELSSNFASFYFGEEKYRKVTSAVYFLRFPLLFFFLVFCGSGGISAVFRVVHAVTIAAARRYAAPTSPSLANNLHALPEGYPYLPLWMQRARLAIPSVIESVVKKTLCFFGVPALADLQKQRFDSAMEAIKKGNGKIMSQTANVVSGPMVPLVIFLPVFSFSVLSIARGIVARQGAIYQEENVNREGTRDEDSRRLAAENAGRMPLSSSFEYSAIPESDVTGMSVNDPLKTGVDDNSRHQNGERKENDDKKTNKKGGDSPSTLGGSPPKKLGAFLGLDSPKSPNTIPTSRDLSPITPLQEDVGKSISDGEANGTNSSLSQGIQPTKYNFKGEVVAALGGIPSVNDANVLLVAASKYNFSRLILPSSLPELSLVSLPTSTKIERVSDVTQHVIDVEEPRGLVIVGVFLRPVTDDTVELSQFTHPTSAVYVFLPARGGDEENVLPFLVEHRIYSTSSLDESIPVNACFYDRHMKEKLAEGSA